MPGRPSKKVFCQSMTRRSNYTVQCKAKGYLMKSGFYRCKNHGGFSTGPTSDAGKLKAMRNLVSMKNKTDDEPDNFDELIGQDPAQDDDSEGEGYYLK